MSGCGGVGLGLAAGGLLLAACDGSLPPLRGQMVVGRDAYALFVAGDGPAGGDLYAVRTAGGPAIQVTFTTVGEMRPALSPDGTTVAFLRGRSLRDSTPGSLWVMSLLSGTDREVALPRGAGVPRAVAWAKDGRTLVVRTDAGLYRVNAPPAKLEARAVEADERAAAESSLAVLLGNPAFARVVPCAQPGALCVQTDTGAPGLLAQGARDPFRWGDDSVAYFLGDRVEIRPLGPGRARRLDPMDPASRPREMTVFLGRGE
jgi:WD40-like Beta Propeller Repeat